MDRRPLSAQAVGSARLHRNVELDIAALMGLEAVFLLRTTVQVVEAAGIQPSLLLAASPLRGVSFP